MVNARDKNLDLGSADLIWCTPTAVCFFNLSEAFNLHNHAFLTIFIPINYLGGGVFSYTTFQKFIILKILKHFWKFSKIKKFLRNRKCAGKAWNGNFEQIIGICYENTGFYLSDHHFSSQSDKYSIIYPHLKIKFLSQTIS